MYSRVLRYFALGSYSLMFVLLISTAVVLFRVNMLYTGNETHTV
jgi:hypothetical protein